MGYFTNREARKNQASLWTKKMLSEYSDEIKECVMNSVIYSPNSVFTNKKESGNPQISFLNTGTVEAAFECSPEQYGKMCLLNFASYKNAGGMFLEGSSAQEEMLCHSSYLYNVLNTFENYYSVNRTRLNKGLYHNRAIYSPNIRFFSKDGSSSKLCDVVTCAAPNRSLIRYGNFTSDENLKVLKDRCQFLRNVVEEHSPDTLVLGAWGCGVFGQIPEEVCQCLYDAFSTSSIPVIIFAVPGNDQNALVFKAQIS